MHADAATRVLVHENALKNGLSEVQADFATMESMNFHKRGASSGIQYMHRMIPFFSAQIQGLSVLAKAFRGNMPFNEQLQIKQKFFNNAALLFVTGLAYAAAMEDDEYYKNAKPRDKMSFWFVPLPGVKEPIKIPIPFEFGFFFSAAIGTMGIPEMRKRGYPDSLATGCIVAGGTLGILIPPSVTMIIYGIATQTSIGKLFLAGVVPGILITIMMCIWVVLYSQWARRKRARQGGNPASTGAIGTEFFDSVTYSWKEKFSALSRVAPFIFLIIVIMSALYGGWATPSEAAGVGSVTALLMVMAIYKLRSPDYLKIMRMTIKESTMILVIIAASFLFGAVLTKLYITQSIINAIVDAGLSKWTLMIMINIFLLVLGCFMPPVAIILILAPILYQVLIKYGFDPIWFGVIMTINMEVGLITPPVGLNLYVVQGIAPDVPLTRVLAGSAPFVIILMLGMVICSIWPELTLWLPNKMITR